MFYKYQHIERYGNEEVEDIDQGECFVFAKIDGTNGQIWKEGTLFKAGSRNREISIGADNQGFCKELLSDDRIHRYLNAHSEHRLFGEWLIPHSLKTYRDDAWRKFYVFDVGIVLENGIVYLSYETYQPLIEEFKLDYIPLQAKMVNGTYEQFLVQVEKNTFLIKDGAGSGEGIVIKNYEYKNKYGRVTWAKIVKTEFKEIHSKVMGAPIVQGETLIEQKIVDNYLTDTMIEKEFEKIKVERDGWRSQYIPELFGRVYHTVITEEMWNIVKDLKNPKINFRVLQQQIISRIKKVKTDIF